MLSDRKSRKGTKLQLRDEFDTPIYTHKIDEDNPRLSHSEFWKRRGGLMSYSDLQEEFFTQVSQRYSAKRGESFSLIKHTNPQQQERFNRSPDDQYDSLYFDDLPY